MQSVKSILAFVQKIIFVCFFKYFEEAGKSDNGQ